MEINKKNPKFALTRAISEALMMDLILYHDEELCKFRDSGSNLLTILVSKEVTTDERLEAVERQFPVLVEELNETISSSKFLKGISDDTKVIILRRVMKMVESRKEL